MNSSYSEALLRLLGGLALLCGLGAAAGLHAQTAEPADPRQAAAAERAQREADKVYKWILIHADKPKRAIEPKPAAAVVPAPKPVARPKDEGITERVTPLAPAPAVARAAPAASTAAAPAAETAAAAPTPSSAVVALPAAPAEAPASSARPAGSLALAPPTAVDAAKPAEASQAEPEEDMPLVLLRQVDPEFPPAIVRRLQKGSVRVRFEVQPDGSVKEPEVVKSSHARLNPAALDAVAQWKFQPLHHSQYGIVELVFDIE